MNPVRTLQKNSTRGYTILELSLSLAIFGIILVTTSFILFQTQNVWVSSDAEEAAAVRLRAALARLDHDVAYASADSLSQTKVPASLSGGGNDGDAFWFLSPIDPTTEQLVRNDDGQPIWQRNILYYLVVPSDEAGCQGKSGPDGYEQGCPHKVLVRKVIDNRSGGEQVLLKDVKGYLTRPLKADASVAPGPNVDDSHIVGTSLLWFRILPDPANSEGARIVDGRSVALELAQRNATVGPKAYASGPYTRQTLLSVKARN